ncbi:hypothetical protein [Arthrobacter sp. NEB 688]|uniref:hypothetical protein n=1 Tax=Arthrobacter sp. NEB 688 TaxID=904039 RepID=UPI0015655C76|nr:hypothetical protein [Arthrobacter sp. NEB 688]QKE83139.1 hypothetical protein HL663_03660 [Arthrobacter sp. NEB 688]
MDRETLWYDHALGVDRPQPAPWVLRGEAGDASPPPPEPLSSLVAGAPTTQPWPRGLWDDARRTTFGDSPTGDARSTPAAGPDALLRLAARAVAAVRRDPDDPYNDHRAYASPRCLFPVVASVVVDGEWHVLDPDRRAVLATGVAADPEHAAGAVALTGRWDAVPSGYGWFRGSLVALETGILVRHLAALSRLDSLPLTLHAPRPGWETGAPARLWREPGRWSPPWVLTPTAATTRRPDGVPRSGRSAATDLSAATDPSVPAAGRHLDDAAADLARVYRSHTLERPPVAVAPGLPADHDDGTGTWADVLWRRSAGRMPRGLYGFRVADAPVSLDDAQALVRWPLAPSPVDDAVDGLRLHAVVRDVPGLEPGVHEVLDGCFHHRTDVPDDAVQRLAGSYLYGSDELSRNDIARAPLVLVVTTRPRASVGCAGPGAWTATHVATGWRVHGLGLGAAARHLVARPVRALDERDVADALALDPDEMPGIAVVVSHHAPHGGLQIDLRS